MHEVRYLDAAVDDLRRLDKTIARRILSRITWLGENVESVRLETLTGEFSGLSKLRVGDYRVLYEIIPTESILLVHAIGHRRDIYKR